MNRAPRTEAHALLEALVRVGVRRLYGVPGHGAYPLYDAINDVAEIEPVVARHEQGATFAALGEAWATGRPAVATAVPRAGLANAATALMEATASQDPLLFIVEEEEGQHLLAREVARHHVRAGPDEPLGAVAERILHRLATDRPGGVILEVPGSVLTAPARVRPGGSAGIRPPEPVVLDDHFVRVLSGARRPLVLAGASALACATSSENNVAHLAEALGAPLLADGFAPGLLPPEHELSIPCGWSPDSASADLVARADAVVVVGTPLAVAQNTARWDPAMLAGADLDRALFVDWDDADQSVIGGGHRLRGRAPAVIDALAASVPDRRSELAPGWAREDVDSARNSAKDWLRALPDDSRQWLEALVLALPAEGTVLADSLLGVWLHRLVAPPRPRRLRFPWGTGTLGAALPAAIGVKLARPDEDVAALCGDGAFLYSANELATLRQLSLPLTIVVANDNAFGAVRDSLIATYGRSTVHGLANPDFVALAESFGISGIRCRVPEELHSVLARARADDGATLVEIPLALHGPEGAFA